MKVGDIEHREDGDYKLVSCEKQGDKWLRMWIKISSIVQK